MMAKMISWTRTKSDMFACISSNGVASSQHDDRRIVLDDEGGPAVIIGFLSQRHQYGSVLLDKNLRRFCLYICHESFVANWSITSDWEYCQIVDRNTCDEEAMVYYVHTIGDQRIDTQGTHLPWPTQVQKRTKYLPMSRGSCMLNQRECMMQIAVIINGMVILLMPVIWAQELKPPSNLSLPFHSLLLLLFTTLICN